MPHLSPLVRGGIISTIIAVAIQVLGVQAALYNVSIDDTNTTRIDYFGDWIEAKDGTFGLHHVANVEGLSARFKFTGVALYYMANKWPYPVGTQLTLFTGATVSWKASLDLQDYRESSANHTEATMESEIVASVTNLPNTEHSLVIEIAQERPFAVVDQIIYTVDDGIPETSQTGKKSSLSVGAVAGIGASAGIMGLLVVVGLIWFVIKKRRTNKQVLIPTIDETPYAVKPNHSDSQWGAIPTAASTYGTVHPYDPSSYSTYSSDGTTYTKASHRLAQPLQSDPLPHIDTGLPPPQYEQVVGSNVAQFTNRPEKSRQTMTIQSTISEANEPSGSANTNNP